MVKAWRLIAGDCLMEIDVGDAAGLA